MDKANTFLTIGNYQLKFNSTTALFAHLIF